VRAGSEECDDGDLGDLESLDGCSYYCWSYCSVECGYTCTGGEERSSADTCSATCGDGVRSHYAEECDDGNLVDGDGCSSGCEVEEGWTCVGGWCETGTCSPVCGDGIVIRTADCDYAHRRSQGGNRSKAGAGAAFQRALRSQVAADAPARNGLPSAQLSGGRLLCH